MGSKKLSVIQANILSLLRKNPAKVYYYSSVAVEVGVHQKGIGSSMRALGVRGFAEECARVILKPRTNKK